MEQNYLIIENNVVTNVCVWDGNTQSWTPPKDAIMLIQSTTPAMIWIWDSKIGDFFLIEQIGVGGIGFIWDGFVLTTNEPKPQLLQPAFDQPKSSGTQML